MPTGNEIFWSHGELVEDGKVACKYCSELYSGGITRFKYHLAGFMCYDVHPCRYVPLHVKEIAAKACRDLNEKPTKKQRLQMQGFPTGSYGSGSSSSSNPSLGNTISSSTIKGAFGQRQTISSMFKKQEHDKIDKALFRAIVMNDLPFNLLRSNDFKNFVAVVANHVSGYSLPSSETAITRLVSETKQDVEAYINEMKKTWLQSGCTIMSNIWKDTIRNRSYINLLISCSSGIVFWKTQHIENDPKNAEFITDFLSSAIEEIGKENVVQIVTNNESNYRRAKIVLEERYPLIFITSCAAHSIDLMLEDIAALEDVANIMRKASQIVKFLYSTQHALEVMRTHTKGKELKRPNIARFATHFICLYSILKQEEALRFMVTSNEWRHLEDVEKDKAKDIACIIQNDDFWKMGKEIAIVVEPLIRVLKMVDGERATMGYLYEALDRAKEAIKIVSKDKKEKYMPYWAIIDKRWNNNLHSPIHAAAAYLNPRLFWKDLVTLDHKVYDGLNLVIKKLVSSKDHVAMSNDLAKYHCKDSIIFDEGIGMCLIDSIHPCLWWDMIGSSVPVLQRVAIKILGQPCSASACERNWSAFDAINTKKRNNLTPSRLMDLVFIRMNMHLQNMAPKLKEMNASPIYIDHVRPFDDDEDLENNLFSDSEEESNDENGRQMTREHNKHLTHEEDDSTS